MWSGGRNGNQHRSVNLFTVHMSSGGVDCVTIPAAQCINCIDHRGGAQAEKWGCTVTLLDRASAEHDDDSSLVDGCHPFIILIIFMNTADS